MPLIYCGIDEAGYGPLLGPMCVGMSAFCVDEWTPGQGAPDLWSVLRAGVCRKPSDKRRRVAIDDSKRLKLANDGAAHPWRHLERGVLATLATLGARPSCDHSYASAVGIGAAELAWYGTDAVACPAGIQTEEAGIAGSMLARALNSAGVRTLDLRCVCVEETSFNRIVEQGGGKGAVSATTLVMLLRHIAERLPGWVGDPANEAHVRVVCDQLGGRTNYTDILAGLTPGCDVVTLVRAGSGGGAGSGDGSKLDDESRYRVRLPGTRDGGARGWGGEMVVSFRAEADGSHLPVALASMAAKLTREMMMARFNRYWSARLPELKPTAGYRQDAARWLRDAGGVISADERKLMIRRA